jgi:hypothetical protein
MTLVFRWRQLGREVLPCTRSDHSAGTRCLRQRDVEFGPNTGLAGVHGKISAK